MTHERAKYRQKKSVICPKCKRESFNLVDVEYKYCSKCGYHTDFHKPKNNPDIPTFKYLKR